MWWMILAGPSLEEGTGRARTMLLIRVQQAPEMIFHLPSDTTVTAHLAQVRGDDVHKTLLTRLQGATTSLVYSLTLLEIVVSWPSCFHGTMTAIGRVTTLEAQRSVQMRQARAHHLYQSKVVSQKRCIPQISCSRCLHFPLHGHSQ
jgi:hypothetical protein